MKKFLLILSLLFLLSSCGKVNDFVSGVNDFANNAEEFSKQVEEY
jgi:hypothetical protein